MKYIFKRIFIFAIIVLLLVAFSGSYKSLSIDKLAYVVAIGIDKSPSQGYNFSFQFTNVTSSSESGTAEKSPSIVNNVEANSIGSAINLMNTYIGKRINLSHCKVIVFSEEVAIEGISKHVYTLMNDTQIRPSANIVVSKCNAKYYIQNSKPILENLITKYYDIFDYSSNFTGYSADATIGDFLNKLECDTCNPVAILGGMNTENISYPTDITENQSSSIKANESTIFGKRGSENIGLAAFRDDKLVGELNASECMAFLNMTNQAQGFFLTIPDPEVENNYLDIYMSPKKPTKISVKITNGTPFIKLNFYFSGRIYSIDANRQYLDEKKLEAISSVCDSYLESAFSDYLYKTSKELKSDINEFGKYALSLFLTTNDFNNYNWNENYKDAFFDVDVSSIVESSILLTET
ncbi:MAG: hypothetical protein J5881_01740 [Clostridia bacterium]|nr:hypothetical protein [Clostridia bacterium]